MKRRTSITTLSKNHTAAGCLPTFVEINIHDGLNVPTLKQKLEKPSRVLGYKFLEFCEENDENDEYMKLDHAECTFQAISRKKEPPAPVEDDVTDLAYSDPADDPANAFLFCCEEDDDYKNLDHADDVWAA
eukprot:CAMPEP_0194265542 /NCGR_PEP_ID=MMETSP0169-20130528/747_1 /TAXON_ID=218684 /ORGANISM="Corethron pennatum, Strain L29A3" /LENGTH=130 /DNA_ID=CAMNT_0039006025 /DNA_START=116 /DNA_END=508 /DNA_ORIENTATION=-